MRIIDRLYGLFLQCLSGNVNSADNLCLVIESNKRRYQNTRFPSNAQANSESPNNKINIAKMIYKNSIMRKEYPACRSETLYRSTLAMVAANF
jgi:hypothetical protein